MMAMIGRWAKTTAWMASIVFALAVTGCGLLPDVKDETAGWSAEKLYGSAHDAMLEGN